MTIVRGHAMHATAVAAALFALAACSFDEHESVVQLAARVNGTEISLHRVLGASEAGTALPEPDRKENVNALERVIDQELLVQGALALKLDRQPEVATAMENARRQILAHAFVEKAAAVASKNTAEEIHAFYESHPALFEQRRVYRFQEIAVAAPKDELESLQQEAVKAKSMDDVAKWLRSRNLAFNVATATRPAEQLPLNYLPQLSSMSAGQISVFTSASGVSVIQLLQSQEAPLNEKQAAPIIDRFLQGRKRLQIAEEAVTRLRERATIEYVGEFSKKRPDADMKQRSIGQITTAGGGGRTTAEAGPVTRSTP